MDPAEIASWPDHTLLSLARNQSAKDREQALRVLVERNSPHINHPELVLAADRIMQENARAAEQQRPKSGRCSRQESESMGTSEGGCQTMDRLNIGETL
jgi:hypothetical protein